MNKTYRIVWNTAKCVWEVVSELAKRRKKRTGPSKGPAILSLSALAVGIPLSSLAQTVSLPDYTPTGNDGHVGSTVVADGATVTLQGSGSQVVPGINGIQPMILADMYASGLTTDPHANPADPASLVISTGNKTQVVVIPDPITGGSKTVVVYSNSNISDAHAPYVLVVNGPTNGRQYIDARMGEVDPSGGTLNVAIGSLDGATDTPDNYINLGMAKQTSLFFANGTGTAASTVVWQGSNRVNMGTIEGATNIAAPGPVESASPYSFNSYAGTFTAFDGSTHTVNNVADFQAYNTFLIEQLSAGNLAANAYDAQFAKAYSTTRTTITYLNGPPLPDESYDPIGLRAVLHADGANAQGVVAVGARLDVESASGDSRITPATTGAGLLASTGGTVTNNGQVSVVRSTTASTAGLLAISGGHAVNNGVLNAGFLSGTTGDIDPAVPPATNFRVSGAQAMDAGSTFSNGSDGIINVAAGGSRGIQLTDGGIATNAGTINVGVNLLPVNSLQSVGVLVSTAGAQFTNLAGGEIYLGRQAQYTKGAPVSDLSNAIPIIGIHVESAGQATNEGTISIGAMTQGSTAFEVVNASGAALNSGTININGAASSTPTENQGMLVINSTNAINSGIINVNGINGIGLKLLSGSTTTATSSGTINVAGRMSDTGLRNFGIWSQGASSLATLSGDINLRGIGGIGVHARDGGSVDIAGSGNVNFVIGSDQIGYFLYGTGATVSNTGTAVQDVSTVNSKLFRIEDGAAFSGDNVNSMFTASGRGSTAFLITGKSSTFNSGNITVNLTGRGAIGVVAEGGAMATITNTAIINQSGEGTIAAIVDGQKYDINGVAVGNLDPTTSLDTAAALNSSLDEVTGYVARNQGTLTNTGSISFTGNNATGIRVESGATAGNSGQISVTDGSIGILVDGTSTDQPTTASNSGTLTVAGGGISDRSRGIVADGPQATANMVSGSTFNLTGTGAIGAQALNGGTVTVVGTAIPIFTGTDQIAFNAVGAGSTVSSSADAMDATGTRSTLFRIEDGARMSTSATLTSSGQDSAAILTAGVGARTDLISGELNVTGAGARGMVVEGGGAGTIHAETTVNLTGSGAVVGLVDGQKHDLAGRQVGALDTTTTLTNRADMNLAGPGAVAFIARNQGLLVNQGVINLTGDDGTGVHVLSGGMLDNQADITTANGTGINMEGDGSIVRNSATVIANNGTAALHLHDGAGTAIGGHYLSDGTAHTVLVGEGAAGLTVNNATLTSNGAGSGIENAAETAAIVLANATINIADGAGIRTATALNPDSTVDINISGNGTGLLFQTAAGNPTSGNLVLGNGYVFNGNGTDATGILVDTSGSVTTNATVSMVTTAGSALVAGKASETTNTGSLVSASMDAPVVDLSNGTGTTFTNQGMVTAVDNTHTAVLGSSADDAMNLAGGAITGIIRMGEGSDAFHWNSGAINGSVEMGADDDTLLLSSASVLDNTHHVDGGDGQHDVLTFAGTTYRGGSFASDDLAKGLNLGAAWETINLSNGSALTLTDDLRLGGSTVNIDASSTLYAGDGLLPTISGPDGDLVTLNNAGTIDLTNGDSGATDRLTINGAYVGQGGRLLLDTVLNEGGANSISDVLRTNSSAGRTAIQVQYDSDNSALTIDDGILLVDVSGDQSAAAAFTLANRVVGGAYEYLLFQGGATENGGDPADGNWYLRNVTDDPTPPDPPDPPTPPDPPDPPDPPTPPEPLIPILRPEAGVYMANQMATRMFMHTLHDRLGEVDYSERARSSNEQANGIWFRVTRNQFDTRWGERGQQRLSTDSNVYQLGSELLRWDAGDRRLNLGVMGGYGQAQSRAESRLTGYRAKGEVDGYAVGLYATWFQTTSQPTGLYLDSWLQYGHFNQWVSGDALARENYKSETWTASLEIGYAFELGRGENDGWYLEPQLQIAYNSLSGADHVEFNGTRVRADADELYSRIGARFYPRPLSDAYNRMQPFVEVNWLNGDVTGMEFNGAHRDLETGQNTYELKIGAQMELGAGLTGWGQAALQEHDGDGRNVTGLIGVKYDW